jgi:hypothetical protein
MNEVGDTLARCFLALDDHDWDGVTECLGETVRRDYRSLFGMEPDEPTGPDLVAEWRGVLSGLDAHQHLLGPAVVTLDGDEARAAAHVVATHVREGDPGSPWVVGGTYRFRLRRDGERWRVVALTLDTRWQTGDTALLDRAASRSVG